MTNDKSQHQPTDEKPNGHTDRPEWIWYCESTSGVPVVTFGRWPKHPQQVRYKIAEIQPTEHDHPVTVTSAHPSGILAPDAWTTEEILAYIAADPCNGVARIGAIIGRPADLEGPVALYREPLPPQSHVTAPEAAVKAIQWTRGITRSAANTITGHYEIIFDRHEWVLDVRNVGLTASVIEGRFPNRTTAETRAQQIHNERILAEIVLAAPSPAPKVTVEEYATRLFSLHGFMLCEEYRGKYAVTVTFPDLKEAQQFHGTLVELSQHRVAATEDGR